MESTLYVNTSTKEIRALATSDALPFVRPRLQTHLLLTTYFFATGAEPALLDSPTFRVALKSAVEPSGSVLALLSAATATGADNYEFEWSSVDSAALRTLLGDESTASAVLEIEWTIGGTVERASMPVVIDNAWIRSGDEAPDPTSDSSWEWLKLRAPEGNGFSHDDDAKELTVVADGSGTVTSVAMSVPTGFAVAGSPITSNGTLAVTYGAGYQGFTATESSKLAGIEAAADVTDAGNVGSSIHGATGKTTPVDADTVPLIDSAASNVLKKLTWANIKATIKTYFDALYVTGPASATDNALVRFDGTTGKLVQTSGATLQDSGDLTCLTVSARAGETSQGGGSGGDGGILVMGGGPGAGEEGGSQISVGGNGGDVYTPGGAAFADESLGYAYQGGTGGTIDASGEDATTDGNGRDGGSITTARGGGSINTRGQGIIELGEVGQRTTLRGAAAADMDFTLPSSVGTDGQVLTSDGLGGTAWETVAGTGDADTAQSLAQFAATTSDELRGVISDETGSGALVFATSPTLVTPALGTPASGDLSNCTFPTLNQNTTGTAAGLSATLAIASGGTGQTSLGDVDVADFGSGAASSGYILTADGTGGLTFEAPVSGSGGDAFTTNPLSQFAATTSDELRGVISDETGTGALVFADSPTLVTPALGTPASGNLANCTFPTLNQNTTGTAAGLSATLAIASGGTGQTTAQAALDALLPAQAGNSGKFLTTDGTNGSWGTPAGSGDVVGPASSTDGVPALFDGTTGKLLKNSTPTGTGNPVLATSPTLVTPALGTPSSGTLTNCTGLPVSGLSSFTGLPIELGYACSDETTALTTGEKVAFYAPLAFTLTSVEVCVTTAPTGSALTVDVESPAGTSLLSSVASISASAFTATGSVSGGSQSIAKGDRVSIDIDQIGATIAGAGLKVTLIGTRA